MQKKAINYFITGIGLVLGFLGLYFVKTMMDPQGFMKVLPYVCIGLGCGAFGHGMGNIISYKTIHGNPALEKQMEIEKSDERNMAIANRAKAKAYDLMTFAFGALMVTFALMGVDLVAILLLVITYLLVHGYGIYFRCKYEKEM